MKKKNSKIIIFSGLVFLLIFTLIGYKTVSSVKINKLEKELAIKEEKVKKEHQHIKEELVIKKEKLISLRGTEEALQADIPMQERVELYLDDRIDEFGFIYYDLTTGEKIVINENKVFTAASTYKLGLNMVIYADVINGKLKINDGIMYNEETDYEDGSGILQGEIYTTLTEPVELQRLLDLSIIESDNIASKMLKRTLGGDKESRERINSMAGITCDTDNNKTTPAIQFNLLKKLYENRENEYYAHLLDMMKSTAFHDRIDKYLPYYEVAHKIGSYQESVHDIGIVFTDRPYILIMYSESKDEWIDEEMDEAKDKAMKETMEKIAKISEMVYKEQLKK